MKIITPQGTKDVLPKNAYKWRYVESLIHNVCRSFGYQEIRTPVFEYTELFSRGIGNTTDVVQKEMYTFEDKGGRSITLRPEGTAGVVRSYLENSLYANAQPTKLYYTISCFRHEKPQAGRLRQFHQFGVEAFGSVAPAIDAEIIALAMTFIRKLGIEKLTLKINSIGCPACRKAYNEKLMQFFNGKDFCETCMDRLERNPMRILDCKSPHCQNLAKGAPMMLDNLCAECDEHFKELQRLLAAMEIPYDIDSGIVRGLDYYTRTVFEIVSDDIGAQGTVCGGGRYDGLVEELGGTPTPGIGFGLGLERLLMVLDSLGIEIPESSPMELYIANLGQAATEFTAKVIYKLRNKGIYADMDYMGRSLKAQMKYADKVLAKKVLIIGEQEIQDGRAKIKDMATGEEIMISLENIEEAI